MIYCLSSNNLPLRKKYSSQDIAQGTVERKVVKLDGTPHHSGKYLPAYACRRIIWLCCWETAYPTATITVVSGIFLCHLARHLTDYK